MQSFIQIDSPFYLDAGSVSRDGWSTVFGNHNPLALEIGCGTGDFIVKVAGEKPGINFIAIDYYNKGCFKTCRRLERHGLKNVRVLRVEARQFVAEYIPRGSLAAVYINCPDPWPKKRHRKRRLVNRQFMEFILPFLAPGGEFNFATDFADYGIDVAGMLAGITALENCLAPDLYRNQLADYHLSKYMLKFLGEGHSLYFMRYRRPVGEGEEGHPPRRDVTAVSSDIFAFSSDVQEFSPSGAAS